ncbi:MAG: class I and II aminotransferase [Bacteroidetes bacterium]|nr:MAG: class I and II aminotransferase [Bacteroidota bacterium]
MLYRRMPIEAESPEEYGYDTVSCNLAESSVSDVPLEKIGADFSKLPLSYGDHRGLPELRSLLAADAPGLSADDMLVTPGAAAALFFLHTALLEKGDHLIVIHPNYATNLETPYAIGCEISKIDLRFEEGFRLDPARIREAIRPGTKLISITSPHNPTGTIIPQETIKDLAALAAEKGCKLLVDETYRELAQGIVPPSAATFGPQVITVSSVSKAYGIPGLRIGWIMCSDKILMQTLLAAKEQVIICNSVLKRKAGWKDR